MVNCHKNVDFWQIIVYSRGGDAVFRVLILESNEMIAKGLKALASEVSNEIKAGYCLNAESALEAARKNKIDLFVISIQAAQADAGYCFARMIKEVAVYEVAFTIFLTSVIDDEIRRITDEFYCAKLLTTPINQKIFKETLSTLSAFEIVRRESNMISLIKNNTYVHIDRSNVLWAGVNSETKIITLHMIDKTVKEFSQYDHSFDMIEEVLGSGFIRIHRSFIVNMFYIEKVDYKKSQLRLTDVENDFRVGITYIHKVKLRLEDDKNPGGELEWE